jgi:threonyl-tRNA synthetase
VGVVGGRDEENETVSLRERHVGDRGAMRPEDIAAELERRVAEKS